ncbi:MAG: PDZ domain-containing protein [Lachnospiraceae bacterium]|nr:PDZ domain-containing protein [Lachnospiraceae bacterium]
MSSEQSDWKESLQDKLQEIKDKRQNAEAADAEPTAPDPSIGFMQEEIKKRPLNRKKMMRRMTIVAVMAAVFGTVACLFFLLLEPIFNRMLYPEEAVTGVTYPEETVSEELTPEEMLVNEEEKAATEEQERIRQEVEQLLLDKTRGAEAANRMYEALRQVAADARYYLVDVSGITSDTDWLNDPYETRGTVSGIIIAKADAEIQVLTYSPGIDHAESIQITLFDGTTITAQIRARDRVSGLAVLSADIGSVSDGTKESLTTAELGSSSASLVTGQLVIAAGRPIGTSGSIAYGMITSAAGDLAVLDSGFKQLTTDIVGSKQASGVLIDSGGRVVGILDPRHGRSDLPGILYAIGITECKQLVEKLSAGGEKAYLGVQCTDVPDDVRKRMDIPEGVYLSSVEDDSPAMNAGLQKGDIITVMDGEDVHYSITLSRVLIENEAGTEISITLKRPSGDGYTEMDLTVTLE